MTTQYTVKKISSLGNTVRKSLRYYKNFGLLNTIRRIKAEWVWEARSRQAPAAFKLRGKSGDLPFNFLGGLGSRLSAAQKVCTPLVSIIVPCHNDAPFLRKRLDSLFCQTYTHYEVLLLDDASDDGSDAILREYATRFPQKIRLVLNTRHDGSLCSQWRKGIQLAQGELVHIAQSGDYCDENFLKILVPFFAVGGVELAFSDLCFFQDEKTVGTPENSLRPLASQWCESAVFSAHEYVRACLSHKNTLPHTSGVLFRKKASLPLLDDLAWQKMRLYGHWVFYLEQIRSGFVAFSKKTKCSCRVHDGGGDCAQNQACYEGEHEIVARRLARFYKLEEDIFRALHRSFDKNHAPRGCSGPVQVSWPFDLDAVLACRKERTLNVAIVPFAFTSGGGEIFALRLAGGLYGLGCTVTLLNAGLAPEMPGIRAMLDRNVPCVDLDAFQQPLSVVLNALGADIVHSHHAVPDRAISREKRLCPECAHVVTTHGMYEAAFHGEEESAFSRLRNTVDMWIYVAGKNLPPLLRGGAIPLGAYRHIPNAIPPAAISPVARNIMGIAKDDFVLCLASRALPEKGWEEAVQAVKLANAASRRKIRLLLVGTGEMYHRLKKEASPDILLLGFKENVRDYFAMADMGFLPSRYAGESQPLAVVECLLAGRPVLASRVGEIPWQLASTAVPADSLPDATKSAGILFDLVEGKIDIQALAAIIVKCAENTGEYSNLLAHVPGAAAKFNFDAMLGAYYSSYLHAVQNHLLPCGKSS